MMIKTETTITFHYPEEMEAEVSFTHDNDMSEWTQNIKNGMVSYTKTLETVVNFGRSEENGTTNDSDACQAVHGVYHGTSET